MNINEQQQSLRMQRRQLITGTGALGLSLALGAGGALAASEPQSGGTLRIGLEGGSASDSLDPQTFSDAAAISISLMLCNQLVELDDLGNPQGELLESWEVKPGATEWLFNIRRGITFPSGKTLDSADVIYSLNLHRGESKSPAKALLVDITEIKRLSATQFQIRMSKGNIDLPDVFSDYHLIVVQEGFKNWSRLEGTGAFALESFQPGVRATVVRKPGKYWKPNRGNFDRVELLYIGDPTARTQALVTGQVDIINKVDPRTASLLRQNKSIKLSRTPGMGTRYAFVAQTDQAPYANRDLMMALKYGIDRNKIAQNVFSGYAIPGNDHTVGPRQKFYDVKQKQITYDPERAKYHFQRANITGALELQVSDGAFSGAIDSALVFQESLSKAGINLNLKRVSGDGYWSNVWLKVPFCAVQWANRPTIDSQLTNTFQAGGGWNDTHFNNPEFERLLVNARIEIDQSKRMQMYARCQELISQNSGMICFAVQDYLDAHSTKLQGLIPSGRFDMGDGRIAEKGWFA
jgi:peptide/nickel transport system substrate-binding protein